MPSLAEDPRKMVFALHGLANVHRAMGDLDAALACLRRADENCRAPVADPAVVSPDLDRAHRPAAGIASTRRSRPIARRSSSAGGPAMPRGWRSRCARWARCCSGWACTMTRCRICRRLPPCSRSWRIPRGGRDVDARCDGPRAQPRAAESLEPGARAGALPSNGRMSGRLHAWKAWPAPSAAGVPTQVFGFEAALALATTLADGRRALPAATRWGFSSGRKAVTPKRLRTTRPAAPGARAG